LGFDPVNANLIKTEILELEKEKRSDNYLFYTSYGSVEELCDDIDSLKSNKLIEGGKLTDVKNNFSEPTVLKLA
jgi:ABC-2 type transport system ATP-binding protein